MSYLENKMKFLYNIIHFFERVPFFQFESFLFSRIFLNEKMSPIKKKIKEFTTDMGVGRCRLL